MRVLHLRWWAVVPVVAGSVLAGCAAAPPAPPPVAAPADVPALVALEQRNDAEVGVFALDTGSGRTVEHRADDRFAHASTFKALLCAVVLDATTGAELERVVTWTPADVVANSPVTGERTSASLRELCDATVRYSDNTAANVLLREFGGPQAVDAALARLGDDVTSLDREEPELSDADPGDLRDTSTPRALAGALRSFVVDDGLAAGDRATLADWLERNTTGDATIRAGAPAGWRVGDKTGTGGYGVRNDIAVLWPPDAAPIVLAVLTRGSGPDDEPDDALVAEATRIALADLAG